MKIQEKNALIHSIIILTILNVPLIFTTFLIGFIAPILYVVQVIIVLLSTNITNKLVFLCYIVLITNGIAVFIYHQYNIIYQIHWSFATYCIYVPLLAGFFIYNKTK